MSEIRSIRYTRDTNRINRTNFNKNTDTENTKNEIPKQEETLKESSNKEAPKGCKFSSFGEFIFEGEDVCFQTARETNRESYQVDLSKDEKEKLRNISGPVFIEADYIVNSKTETISLININI